MTISKPAASCKAGHCTVTQGQMKEKKLCLSNMARPVATKVQKHLKQQRLCRTAASCLQIEAGTTEFTPTPFESRALISQSYSVPRTLLVRFADDSIDATAEIAPVLKQRHPEGGCPGHTVAELVICL